MTNYELRTQCLSMAQKLIDQGYMLDETFRSLANPAYITDRFSSVPAVHKPTTIENLVNVAMKIEAYLVSADDDAFDALRKAAAAHP